MISSCKRQLAPRGNANRGESRLGAARPLHNAPSVPKLMQTFQKNASLSMVTRVAEKEALVDEETCSILDVKIDQESSAQYTKMTIDVMQYPGLLRTVMWTINGLGVRAQNAHMRTDEDGYATQTYWLTDMNGKKLSDNSADSVADRIHSFVQTCMPSTVTVQTEWMYDNVKVSNTRHEKYTEVIVKGEPPAKVGYVLELATVMSAIGATVKEMIIQGDPDYEICKGDSAYTAGCPSSEGHDFANNGRIFRFLLSESPGEGKLSPGRVASILYTLDLVAGKGHQPTKLSQSP